MVALGSGGSAEGPPVHVSSLRLVSWHCPPYFLSSCFHLLVTITLCAAALERPSSDPRCRCAGEADVNNQLPPFFWTALLLWLLDHITAALALGPYYCCLVLLPRYLCFGSLAILPAWFFFFLFINWISFFWCICSRFI